MASSVRQAPRGLNPSFAEVAFSLFDVDGDGRVNKSEVREVMHNVFGNEISDAEAEKMITAVDTDGDGTLDVKEFVSHLRHITEHPTKQKGNNTTRTSWSTLAKALEDSQSNFMQGLQLSKLWRKQLEEKMLKNSEAAEHLEIVKRFQLRQVSPEIGISRARTLETLKTVEKDNDIRAPFDPDGHYKRMWDIVILAFVVYQAFYLPLSVAFQPAFPEGLSALDLTIDVMFMCDIVITFNTAFFDRNTNMLVEDRRKIAARYMKGWLAIDFLSSVPFDLLILVFTGNSSGSLLGLLKVLRLPRLLRLLKMMRILRVMKFLRSRPELLWWLQYSRHANMIRLVKMFTIVIAIIHYLSCAFVAVTSSRWLKLQRCEFADSAEGLSDSLDAEDTCSKANLNTMYWTAFYYSLLLINGEEVEPKTFQEKIWFSVAILFGSIILATIFGQVSMLVASFSANAEAYQNKMEYLFESMSHLRLPRSLKERIIRYYDHTWRTYRTLNGDTRFFFSELSPSLALEVKLFIWKHLLQNVDFFHDCSALVVQQLVLRLETRLFMQYDYIVHEGSFAAEMFVVSEGVCEVTFSSKNKHPSNARRIAKREYGSFRGMLPGLSPGADDKSAELQAAAEKQRHIDSREIVVKLLRAGDYFGEASLAGRCRHSGNVRAQTFCELCVLTAKDFEDVMARFENERKDVELLVLQNRRGMKRVRQHQHNAGKKIDPLQRLDNMVSIVQTQLQDIRLQLDAVREHRVNQHRRGDGKCFDGRLQVPPNAATHWETSSEE